MKLSASLIVIFIGGISIITTVVLAGKYLPKTEKTITSKPNLVATTPTPSVLSLTPTEPSPEVKKTVKKTKQVKTPTATPNSNSSSNNSNSTSTSSNSSNSTSTPTPTPDSCATMSNTSYDQTVLSDKPVLYLPLNSTNTCDHSGNRYDGKPDGSFNTSTLPNGDSVLVFNGSSNYVTVGSRSDLSVPTTGKLTLEAWMRPDVLQFTNQEGSGYVHWLGKGTTDNQEYLLRMYSAVNSENRPNRISGYAFNLGGGLGVGSYFQDSVNVGDWIHVVLVINTVDIDLTYTTGYTKIYKNGVQRDKDSLASLSIVPQYGNAPLRIGTRDFASFFAGAIGKVAVYNYELSAYQVLQHYQKMVPPVPGTASFVQNVGKVSTKSAGTTMQLAVQNNVNIGDTLVLRVVTDYTSGAPTISDNKGNVYTRDRTAPNSGNTIRASIFSTPVTKQLLPGDLITVTTASVSARSVVADEFSGLLSASYLDQQNGATGNSTTPGTTISITTSQANELVLGFAATEGPIDDTFTEDGLGQFSSLTREGTTGDLDDTNVTNNAAFKSVGQTGTYQYKPTLDPARKWILFILSYKAQ